jgi:guanine deaminase
MNPWMKIAINDALKGIHNNEGGPFGAVIVKQGTLISTAHNEVLKTKDPSAHAEIIAIRKATTQLNSPHLNDCELYTTCEPCPMCWGSIYWARLSTIYYGCTHHDAGKLGFIDNHMHTVFNIQHPKTHHIIQIDHKECLQVFKQWETMDNQHLY